MRCLPLSFDAAFVCVCCLVVWSCELTSWQAGYSHAFVVEFASEEDRKYYVDEDPAHLEFKKSLKGFVERVGVMDYTPGVY